MLNLCYFGHNFLVVVVFTLCLVVCLDTLFLSIGSGYVLKNDSFVFLNYYDSFYFYIFDWVLVCLSLCTIF